MRVLIAAQMCLLLPASQPYAQEEPIVDSLKAQRTAAEKSWQEAEQAVQKIAAAWREASSNVTTPPERLTELRAAVKSAVEAAFDAQTTLQQLRLQQAEGHVRRVNTKLERRRELTRQLVAQRIERLRRNAEVVPASETDESTDDWTPITPRPFPTAESLFAEWNRCQAHKDYRGMVSLMDENALRQHAGVLLVRYSWFESIDSPFQYYELREAKQYLQQSRQPNTTAEVRAAEAMLFQRIEDKTAAAELPDLSAAAGEGVLNAARFVVDSIERFSKHFFDSTVEWEIRSQEDQATGHAASGIFFGTGLTATRSDDGWLFSSIVFTDDAALATAGTEQLNPQPTPEALLAEWNRCQVEQDVPGMLSIMDNDAVAEFCGTTMLATVSMQRGEQMARMAGATALDSDTAKTPLLWGILAPRLRPDPDPEAARGWQLLWAYVNQAMYPAQTRFTRAVIDPQELLEQIRAAPAILDSPRAYLAEIAPHLAIVSGSFQPQDTAVNWTIAQEGKHAAATGVSASGQPVELQLRKLDGGWVVHSILSEKTVQSLLPTATTTPLSADQSWSAGVLSKTSTVLTAQDPIVPGDRATPELFGLPETDTAQFAGKYVAAAFNRGDRVDPDQLVQMSLDEVVDLKFNHLGTHPVFRYWSETSHLQFHPKSLAHTAKRIPAWSNVYISRLNTELRHALEKWDSKMLAAVDSLDFLIHMWRESDPWPLQETGQVLTDYFHAHAVTPDEDINREIISAAFLRKIARTTGAVPDGLGNIRPLSAETTSKLTLLETMLQGGAGERWIEQEQVRLAGLLDEAPAHSVGLLIRSGKMTETAVMRHWVYALGDSETYDQYVSQELSIHAPFDPVLLTVMLASLVGESSENDDRMTLLLNARQKKRVNPHDNDRPDLTFQRHALEILRSESGYREHFYGALTTMYRKSKSQKLKDVIAEIAPGVPSRSGPESD